MARTTRTLDYFVESRNNGTYFAVMRRCMWRGQTVTKYVVGYHDQIAANSLATTLRGHIRAENP